eukprot:g1349.t1
MRSSTLFVSYVFPVEFRPPRLICRSGDGAGEFSSDRQRSGLVEIIERKQKELAIRINEIGEQEVLERVSTALEWQNPNPHRFAQLVTSIKMQRGRPVLVFELKPETKQVVQRAMKLELSSVDALCISTDPGVSSSSEGVKSLFLVTTSSVKIPVFAKDWFIHPIQILDVKEAGASGLIGIIASVSKSGTQLLSGYAAALGLDGPVEVVNLQEVKEMERLRIPMFSMNVSVGLSVAGISGIASEISSGILKSLPIGAVSLVGVRSIEEARLAAMNGADGLLISSEIIPESNGELRDFVRELNYITSGDD